MRFTSLLLTAFAGASAVSGFNIRTPRSPYLVKETHNVPSRWKHVGTPASSHIIYLQIGLTQSRFDELETQLYEGTFAQP